MSHRSISDRHSALARDLLAPPSAPLLRIHDGPEASALSGMTARLDAAWQDLQAARGEMPLVSVILPTRNRAAVLPGAVQSVLQQDYENLELLVIDDGSTDGTATLAALQDPRIRVISLPASGVAMARNVGLKAADGSVIAYIDSDNRWRPRHLRDLVTALEITGAACAYDILVMHRGNGQPRYRGEPFDWSECLRGNYVDLNVFAHRVVTGAQDRVLFDAQLRRGVDWDFILRLTRSAAVAFLPVPGCDYTDTPDPQRISRSEPRAFLNLVREKLRSGLSVQDLLPRRRFRFCLWSGDGAPDLGTALKALGHEVQLALADGTPAARAEVAVTNLPQLAVHLPADLVKVLVLDAAVTKPNYANLDRFDAILTPYAAEAAHLTATLRRKVVQIPQGSGAGVAQAIVAAVCAALTHTRARPRFPAPVLLQGARVAVGLIAQRGRNWPNASAYLRTICPLTTPRALKRFELVELSGPDDPQFDRCGVIVLQRFAMERPEAATRLAEKVRGQRARLLVESDDHPDAIGLGDPRAAALRHAMTLADRVCVASPALARMHAAVQARPLPNRLDPRIWCGGHLPPAPAKAGQPMRIVYIGTPTHDDDFRPVSAALDRLWQSHPDGFSVTFLGALQQVPRAPWVDPAGAAIPQTAYPDFCQRALALGPFHLGLAPLAASAKNDVKSDLRCLDNAALGAATLASDAPAYRDAIAQGRVLGTVHSVEGWYDALRYALDASDLVHASAQQARDWLWDTRSVMLPGGLEDHLAELLAGGQA